MFHQLLGEGIEGCRELQRGSRKASKADPVASVRRLN